MGESLRAAYLVRGAWARGRSASAGEAASNRSCPGRARIGNPQQVIGFGLLPAGQTIGERLGVVHRAARATADIERFGCKIAGDGKAETVRVCREKRRVRTLGHDGAAELRDSGGDFRVADGSVAGVAVESRVQANAPRSEVGLRELAPRLADRGLTLRCRGRSFDRGSGQRDGGQNEERQQCSGQPAERTLSHRSFPRASSASGADHRATISDRPYPAGSGAVKTLRRAAALPGRTGALPAGRAWRGLGSAQALGAERDPSH